MRTITTKDMRGLLIAFRVFLRAISGERLSQQAGTAILEKALEKGLTFDQILNKENWGRALSLNPNLTAKDYIEILGEDKIEVKGIKEEPQWYDINNGFAIIAEAAHDFFMEVSGRGGKWNIPSALTNLAKAIREYSLQAILSEKLINEVTAKDEEMTYFGYILAIVKDFDSLQIDNSLTEEQFRRKARTRDDIETIEKEEQVPPEPNKESETEENTPEDSPYPEMPSEEAGEYQQDSSFETTFITQSNPRDMKRDCLKVVIENYTLGELMGLAKTIDGGDAMTISEIVDCLTDGKFDKNKESSDTRTIHQNISADLMPSFIECVHYQGIEMDETLATNYDILHDDWDLRTPEVRKLHKLKRLIVSYGQDDPDLTAAIADIEDLYSE